MSDPGIPAAERAAPRRAARWCHAPPVVLTAGVAFGLSAGVCLSGGWQTFGPASELLLQQGSFDAVIHAEGVVYFPRPYASPPNVELGGRCENTVVTECARDHFRWKNTRTGKNEQVPFPIGGTVDVFGSEGKVQWFARGVSEQAP